MKTITRISALLCMLIFGLRAHAETVETKNPIDTFVDRKRGDRDISKEEEIFMFLLDINGDGIKDVFLSREKDGNGRQDYIWDVYLSDGDKFYRADNGISIPDQLTISRVANNDRIFFWHGTPKSEKEILLLEIALSKSNSKEIRERFVATIKFEAEDDIDEQDAEAIFSLLDSRNASTISAFKGKVPEIKKIYSEQINSK